MLLPLVPLGLAWTCAQAAAEAEPAWQLQVRTDHHSDVLTLDEVDDEAYERARARGRQNLVYVEDEVRLGRSFGGWHLALVGRSSATLVINRDAVEAVAQIAGRPAEGDRRWQTSARLRGFNGAGVELGHSLALGGPWRLGWSAQALALGRLQHRDISGPVRYDAARDSFDFDLRLHTAYDQLDFPFQRSFAARGAGLLFGAELGWQGEGVAVALSVRDLGWLRWKGLPQEEAQLSSSAQQRDADGFLVYKPLIQGRNSQPTYTTHWRARWALRGTWQARPDTLLSASVQTLPGFDGVLPAVGLQQRWSGGVTTGLGWRFHERRALASVGWKGWQLEAGADARGASQHSRVIGLSYGMAL
ncbi:hypothetical protein [Azohydromonas caseinilytica]|uniref:Uncharacterized protein n=1 Tax=Azohydromonas caseinilytica TaxID=2728836 RepID=A0A848F9R2_9BURK|nr:hypothetical protein [Azohydromonas caseinilytica]NML14970.1 hypothetical protein [Azohydromonas caseinilytica]